MADLVTVATYYKGVDAELARLALLQSGIRALLDDEQVVRTDPLLSNAIGGVKLRVAAADVEAARRILAAAALAVASKAGRRSSNNGEGILFDCSECGAEIRFPSEAAGRCESCPHCHRYVDVPERSQKAAHDGPDELDRDPGRTIVPANAAIGDELVSPAGRAGGDWLEVLLVLAVAYVPWLLSTLVERFDPKSFASPEQIASTWNQLAYVAQNSAYIALVLYLIWRNGERWGTFGIARFRWLRDPSWGAAYWFLGELGVMLGWNMLRPHDPESGSSSENYSNYADEISLTPYGLTPLTLQLAEAFTSVLAQELIYRGYLVTRLTTLLARPWLAVAIAAALFASFHLDQSVTNVFSMFCYALVFGTLFLLQRRLWPLVLAHLAYNLYAIYS